MKYIYLLFFTISMAMAINPFINTPKPKRLMIMSNVRQINILIKKINELEKRIEQLEGNKKMKINKLQSKKDSDDK